ncbi:uncharacterized protein LOC123273866 isoform X1 [Cotesia glomerata]|uniref:uncharacterized protein LOC123273866 isoform X1 n=1 Tax=Cotesia glomerata TaxID=32391 RepID=UPI001D02B733|nr:uncharacterized protein LOC123273866 isoform X1 [Cotesia glomerata]XP_044597273.1 uncharacterized protein LOC123273866 isoform X1 [Cotesia glomerata]XP_044597274.1 uncharacterized protein LOC123273866 isoform X1 [Cotesia glomerata]
MKRVQNICNSLANNVGFLSCSRIDHIISNSGEKEEINSYTSDKPFDCARPHRTTEEGAETSPSTTSGEDSSWGEEFEDCHSKWSTDHSSGSSNYFSVDSENNNSLNLRSSGLTLYYQNVRGLNSKLDQIYSKSFMAEYDLFAFSETWLKSGVFDNEIFNNNYSVFRCDRREEFRRSGGGVLIACRNSLNVAPLKFNNILKEFLQIEIVGIQIINHGLKIHLVTIYIPPDLPAQIYSDILELLSSDPVMDAGALVLLGDFNSPYFSDSLNGGLDMKADILINFSLLNNLNQFNDVLNINGRILDLVFSSVDCLVVEEQSPVVKLDTYHPALRILVSANVVRNRYPLKKALGNYNFHKMDRLRLISELELISWEPLHDLHSPNEKCKYLYNSLDSAFSKSIPSITNLTYRPSKYPPWFTSDIINDCKAKEQSRRKLNMDKSYNNSQQYKHFRKTLKVKIKSAYNNYIKRTEDKLISDPKSFWNYIKSKKNCSQFPSSFLLDGIYVDDSEIIANSFAKFFSSVYEKFDDDVFSYLTVNNRVLLGGIELPTELDIMRCINKLPNKMSSGLDGIPCKVVKDCSSALILPLKIIFHVCLTKGIFPDMWKTSKVCPIHKSGDKSLIDNYRPVSIIPAFARIFEMILYEHLLSYFTPYITPSQHGFLKRRSVVTNLLPYTQFISDNISNGKQVDVIHTDFSEAFDKVDIHILIDKLVDLGIPGQLVNLMISYLSNRKNYVLFNGYLSHVFYSTSGVPQGSNLGPLLFIIFINDVGFLLSVYIDLFADDAKIYHVIRNSNDCEFLQYNLNIFASWCMDNKLFLNKTKCKIISFHKSNCSILFDYTIDSKTLDRVQTVNDLGITFDYQLTFYDHYTNLVRSTTKILGFVIRSSKKFKNLNAVKALYISLVRSRLEYASVVWSPTYKKQISLIEKVQRKFVKYFLFKKYGVHPDRGNDYLAMCAETNLLTLEERRICASVLIMTSILSNNIECPRFLEIIPIQVPQRLLRSDQPFYPPKIKNNFTSSSPLYRMIDACNTIVRQSNNFDLLESSSSISPSALASLVVNTR